MLVSPYKTNIKQQKCRCQLQKFSCNLNFVVIRTNSLNNKERFFIWLVKKKL
nr:MAG TPA: hypothetical protein [Caudoviricetes sp.]